MCIFCAAIPMTASIGTAVTVKYEESRREALREGLQIPQTLVSPKKATYLIVTGLVIGSVVYHIIVFSDSYTVS